MSTLETKKIEPLSGTTVTLGAAGDAVTMPAGVTVKTNTVKDAGGNTLWTSDGSGTLSSVNSGLAGNMVFISSQTASNSASLSFTSGIDSTYDEYMFTFVNINPATDATQFQFQVNATDGADYNDSPITSTYIYARHTEGAASEMGYHTSHDAANSTSFIDLQASLGNESDETSSGVFQLFNPASTTYIKHWYCHLSGVHSGPSAQDVFTAGYINDTTAIDDIRFKMSSGNFDGTIAMYGIK